MLIMSCFKNVILGNHKFRTYLPVMDVCNAIYDPLNPDEVIADVHPTESPWRHALVRVRKGKVVKKVLVDIPWGCGDINPYPEEGVLLVTYAVTNVVEVRNLGNLELIRRFKVGGLEKVYSATYDSLGRLWVTGDAGLYLLEGGRAKLIRGYGAALSMDTQQALPSRTLAVIDHLGHVVELLNEDGGVKGRIYFPYPGGVRFTPDERLLISSGRVPNHTHLLLMVGATHLQSTSGWFGYLWDYGTLASNRADSYFIDKVLIQWSLSAFEVPVPLPKFRKYLIRVGSAREGVLAKEARYTSFTPIPVMSRCWLFMEGEGKVCIEVMKPNYSLVAPQGIENWVQFNEVDIKSSPHLIEVPGIYRVRITKGFLKSSYVICKP